MSAFDVAKKYLKTAAREPAPVDLVADESVVAVLIDSAVLGAPVWFALREEWRPDAGDSTPVLYPSELPYLRTKNAQQLRAIFNVKSTFGGGMVRQ